MSDTTTDLNCGSGGGADTSFRLRIASIFIILIGSTSGALFPVLANRSTWLHIPKPIFECVFKSFIMLVFHIHVVISFAKYFGSGVIVRPTHLQGGREFVSQTFFLDCDSFHPSPRTWNIRTRKSMPVSSLE